MRWRNTMAPLAVAGLLLTGCGAEQDSGSVTPSSDEIATDTPATTDDDGTAATTTTTTITTTAPPPESSAGEDTPSTTAEAGDARAPDLLTALGSGAVDVAIDVPEGGVAGELLYVTITNTADAELDVVVPCGLVFVPDGSDEQRMINLTPFELDLGAGATTTITPYVMCIDSSSPAPEPGAAYVIGEFADDDLLAFAECVCDQDLLGEIDPMLGDMSLQMAMWAVADGELPDVDGAITDADGALGSLLGDEAGIDLAEIAELLESQGIDPDMPGMEGFDLEAVLAQASAFLESFATDSAVWLERCDIEL